MAQAKKPVSSATSAPHYALLSVFDKTGIVELAQVLVAANYSIVSTGGTAKVLTEANIKVTPIQDITGNPESFDGRMKTISFQAEGGILFDRTNPEHVKQAKELHVPQIDIVVCNLYPFEQTIAKKSVTFEEAVENIDVGGPTMIRSAAKNHKSVLVVTDPKDYEKIIEYLNRHSGEQSDSRISSGTKGYPGHHQDDEERKFRKRLAAKAFGHLSFYDSQIARYLSDELFPQETTIPGRLVKQLRYGDNPHQSVAHYEIPNKKSPLSNLELRAGRDMSLTNLTDVNAGYEVVRLFDEPAAVVIKHNNPCGFALGKDAAQALERAIAADPESAFGGVVVMNTPMDLKAAKKIADFKSDRHSMMDIIAVPEIAEDALGLIKEVRKTTGVYTFGKVTKLTKQDLQVKSIDGGFILQTPDIGVDASFSEWKVVSKKKPTIKQKKQMEFAWKVISRIKSNAIIVVDPNMPQTLGIGSGQTSRVRSTKIALEQAGKNAIGAIVASDSFFPFDDSVKLTAKAGIAAIVQQGGSVNDQASIDAADKAGIVMVMTGRRAFWH